MQCTAIFQVFSQFGGVGSGHRAGSISEEGADENCSLERTGRLVEGQGERKERGEESRRDVVAGGHRTVEQIPKSHPAFGPLASPVAECIRASFLADIEKATSDFTIDDFSPIGESETMQSTSLIKTWSTPEKTVVQGHPPGPVS